MGIQLPDAIAARTRDAARSGRRRRSCPPSASPWRHGAASPTSGCTLVDTTCGSVLNVWKNVKRYAQDGYTSVIHGKVWHEETQATASQALTVPGGHYLVVLDREETGEVCDYIRHGGDREAFLDALRATPCRPGSIPTAISQRIGLPTRRRC